MTQKNETLDDKIKRLGKTIKSRNASQKDFINDNEEVIIDSPKVKNKRTKPSKVVNERQLDLELKEPSGIDLFLESKELLKKSIEKSNKKKLEKEKREKQDKKQKRSDRIKSKLSKI